MAPYVIYIAADRSLKVQVLGHNEQDSRCDMDRGFMPHLQHETVSPMLPFAYIEPALSLLGSELI